MRNTNTPDFPGDLPVPETPRHDYFDGEAKTPTFVYFDREPEDYALLLKQAFNAGLDRSRRRHWLGERRHEQREAARKNLIKQRIKLRTEKIASRFTNDTSITSGGRLAASTHADARKPHGKLYQSIKALFVKPTLFRPGNISATNVRPHYLPVKNYRAGSISAVPILTQLREALPESILFDWDSVVVPHSATWKFAGQAYTSTEIFEVVAKKIAIADEYKRRMDARKVFVRSMERAKKLVLQLSLAAKQGYQPRATSVWRILGPLPRERTFKVGVYAFGPIWRRPSVLRHVYKVVEKQRRALMQDVDEMVVDAVDGWPILDGVVIAPHNVSWNGKWLDLNEVTVEQFNNATMKQCGELCQAMNVEQLEFLRQHLTKLKEDGKGQVNKDKWSGLNKQIAQKDKQQKDKWGKQGQDDAWGRDGKDHKRNGQNQGGDHWGNKNGRQHGKENRHGNRRGGQNGENGHQNHRANGGQRGNRAHQGAWGNGNGNGNGRQNQEHGNRGRNDHGNDNAANDRDRGNGQRGGRGGGNGQRGGRGGQRGGQQGGRGQGAGRGRGGGRGRGRGRGN